MHGPGPPSFVGVAGWTIPKAAAPRFPAAGSHLERYASRFPCVEVNSSFYRPHRRATWERWSATVPEAFRFAVKVPRALTHERALVGGEAELERFLDEVAGLGDKLGVLLVQLPPSLELDRTIAQLFFERLRARHAGAVACEPRHPTWFAREGEALLSELSIARVAADPALAGGAGEPGGWPGLAYFRLHGTPRVYYSEYGPERLDAWAGAIRAARAKGSEAWCVFDNTALGAASADALAMLERLAGEPSPPPVVPPRR